MLSIVKPTDEMVRHIAKNLRPADEAEIRAHGFSDVQGVLIAGTRIGTSHVVLGPDGSPLAVGGYCSEGEGVASVWLVASQGMTRHRREFLAEVGPFLDDLQKSFPLIYNFVWAGNREHIRLLRWLGCSFINTKRINGNPFYEFIRISPQCASL